MQLSPSLTLRVTMSILSRQKRNVKTCGWRFFSGLIESASVIGNARAMFKSLNEALQALAEVGVTTNGTHYIGVCAEMWEREGPEFFEDVVRSIRRKRELAVACFPKLLAYAAECRVRRPAPDWDSLTDAELEQIRLITESFRELRSREGAFQPKATRPFVVTTTPVGLRALPTFLPDPSPYAAILLGDEFDAWQELIGEDNLTDPWWYEEWWSRVDVEPQDDRLKDRYRIDDVAALRSGGAVWELSFGTASGCLAAVGHEQLFVWDGAMAVRTEFESFWVA